MMAFHRRKLLDESIPDLCQSFCPEPMTACPLSCYKYCPDSCKSSISVQFPPPPPSPPSSTAIDPAGAPTGGLSHALTISLAVLATAFFLFTCYTIYKFYTLWRASRRRRMLRQSQRRSFDEEGGGDGGDDFIDGDVVDHPIWYIRTVGLQPSVINAITVVKYKSGDGIVEGTDCAVCLSEFEEDETVRLLPKCSHAFHIPCIDTWLASHTNCPLCRAGIVAAAGGAIQLQEEPIGVDSRRSDEGSEGLGLGSGEIEGNGAVRSQIGIEFGGNVEGDCKIDVELDAAVQPVRRSVSMDALSASAISAAVANAFPRQCDKSSGDQLGKFESPSIERSAQTGSSSIKRSASCSAKVFLSRHSSRR